MRKLMSYVIVLVLLLTTLAVPHSVPTTVEAATGNRPATFIANRFVKIGFDRDGLPLYPARMFPWQQNENIPVWGRDDYPMPHAFQARGDYSINVPAVIDETDVVPVAWTDVYLTVVPDGGDSQEYDHWYIVLDSSGQLWFDPDGRFHDCRYNAYTDPASSHYIAGSCRTKSHALHGDRLYMVDPMSDNNTQGPYIINPNHRLYNPNTALTFQAKGTRYGTRKWQIGWSDMVDYPPKRNIYDSNPAYENRPNDQDAVSFDPTIVENGQWDVGLSLVPFRTDDRQRREPNFTEERYHEPMARTRNGGSFDPYEYIYRKGCNNQEVLPDACLIDGVEYEAGDDNPFYIFGYTPLFYTAIEPAVVQVGDTRLVPMSYVSWDGSVVKNYEANTVVQPGDLDAPIDYDGNGILEGDERKILQGFASYMKHTETIRSGINPNNPDDYSNIYFDSMYRYGYFQTEFIYLDRDEDATDGINPNGDGKVSIANVANRTLPDLRYSPVNTKLDINDYDPVLLNGTEPYSAGDFDRHELGTYAGIFGNYRNQDRNRLGMGLVGWDAITKTQGDVLILSEILRGGCESPTYDLSVETDVWMGTDVDIATGDINLMPSPAAARLRSPNGDITANAQRIQKNTVLAPNGQSFFIPATTFQNIKLDYREYIGVEIWKDNGIDNHLGINLKRDQLTQQNLTDDFKEERCGEEFIGVVNGVNAKDYNNALVAMTIEPHNDDINEPYFGFSDTDVLYFDTDNPDAPRDQGPFIYGCGEPIYQNKNTRLMDDSTDPVAYDPIGNPHIVNEGDIRINGVHVIVSGNEIQYAAGTIVSDGDADVGFPLRYFNKFDYTEDEWDIRYFFKDESHPDIDVDPNRWYDNGEALYRSKISAVLLPGSVNRYKAEQPHFNVAMLYHLGSHTSYSNVVVVSGMTRLVDVTINDSFYNCGSTVSTGDFWYYQNPIHKISTGFNCDFRFIDEPVLPGPLSLSIKMSTPLKVEQTTQIDIALTTPLKKGEEVHVMVEDVYAPNAPYASPGMINPDVMYKKMDVDHQLITFQYTPYRGSCGELNTNYPARIYAFKEAGGVSDIVPPNSYIDPFYYDFAKQDERGMVIGDAPTPPVPPMPKDIVKAYDCYLERSYNVLPEEIKVTSSTKCIDTLSQRFPNLTLRLNDADNPNDVNDPNNIRISIPYGEMPLVANYNAHNGGIDYMFTAYDLRYIVESSPGGTHLDFEHPKVLVQMNKDGSYRYWYWQDNGVYDVLDEEDIVAGSPLYPNDPNPKFNTPKYLTGYDRLNWIDMDCSQDSLNGCTICDTPEFGKLNKITRGDHFAYGDTPYFEVIHYGVPTKVSYYHQNSGGDQGGEVNIVVAPTDGSDDKLTIRLYTFNALYDYNSTMNPPPFFLYDTSMGIDYCGSAKLKVLPPDPYVNFAEYKIVDHALQNSRVNYTSGSYPLSELPTPVPQIESPYDPIVKDVGKDFRAYPGGQTHTGRIEGSVYTGSYLRVDGEHNGWNAYPAIWWWYWSGIDVDYNNFTDFNRLGTEFFPMTDYSMYFIVKDGEGNHLTFNNNNPDLKIRQLTIRGPFITPYIYNKDNNSVRSNWEYNGVRNVPIRYDRSGEVSIDSSNVNDYMFTGNDWTRTGYDGYLYTSINEYLRYSRELNFRGLTDVFYIPELIPVGSGVITLSVTLWDGTVKIFQDCCAEPPTDGVDVHGIDIESSLETITVDTDTKLELNVSENEVMQVVEPANNAVVVVWQDRGILNTTTGLYDGAGDGWLTNAPASSNATEVMYQFDPSLDINDDGLISFADFETEIVGTYHLATNAWVSGIIDARTFQRDNGKYVFDLSASNGARLNQIGLDFGSFDLNGTVNVDQDHVISEYEALPLYINAYKYADDNNDRAFTPLYNVGNNIPQYSHEVYLAGMKIIDIVPMRDLSVSVSPTVLTAGCIPELVDPASPLTIIVTNEDGEPVDLTFGVPDAKGESYVTKETIWQNLFKDPHPDPLPEYYWLRTDLHNKDMTLANNIRLYDSNFYAIKPDFTLSSDGKYTFNGFCANDQGEFDVFVYSPDRKHYGVGKVKVELPDVSYSILNTEDPSGTAYTIPGEPDFVLTAADNRIYQVTVSCKDARGLMIKGVSKGVSTCGGGTKNTARFTVYTSRPESWNFSEKDKFLFADHFMQDLYPYNLNVGFDFNDNKTIDWRNAELFNFGGFDDIHKGMVYYNTTLVKYDNGEWDVDPNYQLPPFSDPITQKPIRDGDPQRPENPSGTASIGWGLGAIYNHPYHGGYLFVDIDGTGYMDYHDSLGLDVDGQTTFYIFAEDIAYVGGLVGQNYYCNAADEADLSGYPPLNKKDPSEVHKRFRPKYSHDGVFFLDWEAFPNREVQIAAPQFKVLDGETRIELGKNLLNPNYYDLTYAIANHFVVQVTPADSRDLPIHENSRVFMFGNQHQTVVYGDVYASPEDPKVMETTITFTPTGLNEAIAHLGFYNKNKNYLTPPYDLKNTSTYTLMNLLPFDASLGLYIEVLTEGPVYVLKDNVLTVRVKEVGTKAPVEGATVTIKGPGVSGSKVTNASGIAVFDITASETGFILVEATKEGRIIGRERVQVRESNDQPFIEIDPLPPCTNQPNVQITGITNPGNTVTLNGSIKATVKADGSWSSPFTLKEGMNTIIAEARNAKGASAKASITTILDTIPSEIFIDNPGELVDITEMTVTGRVEPDSQKVTVNGIEAELVHDIFKAYHVAMKLGPNTITVYVIDQAGNASSKEVTFYVYHEVIIQLTIGNPEVTIDGVTQERLSFPPYISRGRTMVPLRVITEAFDAIVGWDGPTKTVTITMGDLVVKMTIDQPIAYVNGVATQLDAPPEIREGSTFVPVSFLATTIGAKVEWDAVTQTVTIRYKK